MTGVIVTVAAPALWVRDYNAVGRSLGDRVGGGCKPQGRRRMASYRTRKQQTIELGGLRFVVLHRTFGDDGGASIEVFGDVEGLPVQVLRFDCFKGNPHYHLAPEGTDAKKDLDVAGPMSLHWALEQIRDHMPELLRDAGFDSLAERVDRGALASEWTRIRDAAMATEGHP